MKSQIMGNCAVKSVDVMIARRHHPRDTLIPHSLGDTMFHLYRRDTLPNLLALMEKSSVANLIAERCCSTRANEWK